MNIIEKIHVCDLTNKTRLSDFDYRNTKTFFSRKSLVKAIKAGELKVNSQVAFTSTWLENGDIIEISESHTRKTSKFMLDLQIVYEDDYLAVINKPAGIEVSGNKFRTLENAVQRTLKKSHLDSALDVIRPVHRLDYLTSGLIVFAKTSDALISLSHQFEDRLVKKSYKALVVGELAQSGDIKTPINGKEAHSQFQTLAVYQSKYCQYVSFVKLNLFTGRTHQLRIHLASIDHPILGDQLYTKNQKVLKNRGLFLTSTYLKFKHPKNNKEIEFSIQAPAKFDKYIRNCCE